MSHQIRFFLCDEMREVINKSCLGILAPIVSSYSDDRSSIQFSESAGLDKRQGRLWTDTLDARDYNKLCKAIKKDSEYDQKSGLWFKLKSRLKFEAYTEEKQKELEALVTRNQKYLSELSSPKDQK